MKIRYLGSPYGAVVAPGGVRFDEPGAEAEVDDGWGQKMCTTDQFEAVTAATKPAKKAASKEPS